MFKKSLLAVLLLSIYSFAGAEVYYYQPFSEVINQGDINDSKLESLTWTQEQEFRQLMRPYGICENDVEIYVFQDREINNWRYDPTDLTDVFIAICAKEEEMVSGKIFVAKRDYSGMYPRDFKFAKPNADQSQAKKDFLKAKESHYKILMDSDKPGTAWFRHKYMQASGDKSQQVQRRNIRPQDFERTYELFTGGRALSENLQLDRELRVVKDSEKKIELKSIEGITTAEMDWGEIVKGMQVQKDALAKMIPTDQHVIFFPSFNAMVKVTEETDRNGTPMLELLEPRSQDAQTKKRCERQLCLELTAFAKLLGPSVIKSMAYTGSDPYMRMGTDIAVIFDCINPDAVMLNVLNQHQTAMKDVSGTKKVDGQIKGVKYKGVVSTDKMVSSYAARIDKVVIVSNSLYQLEQIIKTSKGDIANIGSLDEYKFFRNRYKLNDAKESALIILTDATIRRWCSPRWRIGNSRRTRAAAVLAELQCRTMGQLVEGVKQPTKILMENEAKGLGDLTVGINGVSSSVYGNLAYLTPISEMTIDKITQQEADAYNQFRRNYQNNWRQFFDPIAIMISVEDNKMAMDMTVMPLIAGTDYQEFMQVVGQKGIGENAGDRHPEAILHWIMALDTESPTVKQMTGFAAMMAPGLGDKAFNWLGDNVSLYFDDDPFWAEAEKVKAQDMDSFMEKNFGRLPVALSIDVKDSFKLAGFLVAMRAFVQQTAPGLTAWESLKYDDQDYVKISPSGNIKAEIENDLGQIALYYCTTGDAWVITLNENMIKRALDRKTAGAENNEFKVNDWLGESMAVCANEKVMTVIDALFNENLRRQSQLRAWKNIAILNEWKRNYPDMDPVDIHQQFWNMKLICPNGGKYVWDQEFGTMASTVFGHPGKPKGLENKSTVLSGIKKIEMGLTFQDDGLRAKAVIERGD
ncbi:MAG: hypothetical protein JEZ07_02000 [Phycisphaerae bacterium]|nr:hypothetical protein [Phycisphaerae bacterium]